MVAEPDGGGAVLVECQWNTGLAGGHLGAWHFTIGGVRKMCQLALSLQVRRRCLPIQRRNSQAVQSARSWLPWSRLSAAPIGSCCPLGLPPPPQLQSVVVSPSSSYHVPSRQFSWPVPKKEKIDNKWKFQWHLFLTTDH